MHICRASQSADFVRLCRIFKLICRMFLPSSPTDLSDLTVLLKKKQIREIEKFCWGKFTTKKLFLALFII